MAVMTILSRLAVLAMAFSLTSAEDGRAEPKRDATPPQQSKKGTEGNGSAPTARKRLPLPPRDIQLLFIRSALVALNQANKTQNYEVLRALGASNMRKQSPAVIASAFKGLAASGLDLAPALVIEPEFTAKPVVTEDHVLRLTGLFRSQRLGILFDKAFVAESGFWRLAAISAGSAGKLPARKPVASAAPARVKPSAKPQEPRPAYYADGTPVATSAW